MLGLAPGIHVTSAKAGVQFFLAGRPMGWIPAFAGMTGLESIADSARFR